MSRQRSLSPPHEPSVIILGILGIRTVIDESNIIENILTPIVQELGRLPDKVLVPAEGTSSIYIQNWADSLHIRCNRFEADWRTRGKAATIFRDSRIKTEATHLLVFLSPRSTRYEILATNLALRGKTVFTTSYQDLDLEMLEVQPSSSAGVQKQQPAKRGRKSNSGKEQSSLQVPVLRAPGTLKQSSLPWAT
jgi:hypothetical protein